MQKAVTLHGGPWHGRRMNIPSDWVHIHIARTLDNPALYDGTDDKDVPEISVRHGRYSSVAFQPNDFEWDGWEPK